MVRIIVMFLAGFIIIAIGIRNMSVPNVNYLLIAGNLLAGFGLILYAWILRQTGKGNLIAAAIFIVGCVLTVIGNFL